MSLLCSLFPLYISLLLFFSRSDSIYLSFRLYMRIYRLIYIYKCVFVYRRKERRFVYIKKERKEEDKESRKGREKKRNHNSQDKKKMGSINIAESLNNHSPHTLFYSSYPLLCTLLFLLPFRQSYSLFSILPIHLYPHLYSLQIPSHTLLFYLSIFINPSVLTPSIINSLLLSSILSIHIYPPLCPSSPSTNPPPPHLPLLLFLSIFIHPSIRAPIHCKTPHTFFNFSYALLSTSLSISPPPFHQPPYPHPLHISTS